MQEVWEKEMKMWKLGVIIALIIVGTVVIPLLVGGDDQVYGDDTESDLGLCLRHFQRYCDKIDIEKTMDQLLERAREWNRIHNNSNDSNKTTECLTIDAYDRGPDCFVKQAYQSCFSNLDDYFKERLKHINDTDYNIVFPCPELNRSQIPEDESGK